MNSMMPPTTQPSQPPVRKSEWQPPVAPTSIHAESLAEHIEEEIDERDEQIEKLEAQVKAADEGIRALMEKLGVPDQDGENEADETRLNLQAVLEVTGSLSEGQVAAPAAYVELETAARELLADYEQIMDTMKISSTRPQNRLAAALIDLDRQRNR